MSSDTGSNSGTGEERPPVENLTGEERPPVESQEEDLAAALAEIIPPGEIEKMIGLLNECSGRLELMLTSGGFEVDAVRRMQADLENAAAGWRLMFEVRMSVRRKTED